MENKIRPEISKNKEYWIDRHRYYELKHFCLQYPYWREIYSKLDGYSASSYSAQVAPQKQTPSDPVPEIVERRLLYRDRMDLVERIAKSVDPIIGDYIFKGVTEGLSYEQIRARYSVPCCKGSYYDLYRRFFWLLDQARK